ncbi:MAG: AAA family ATPase [Actinomycetota bacterium]|nr:AAA family ATPase [Actinomycetota bacterium]
MTRVLVTGMSGTGKSTVLMELGKRGHRVVDTDYAGWSDDVASPDGTGFERLWREDRMAALLAAEPAGCLFVSGCVANQGRFHGRFDAVVLLSLPPDLLLARISAGRFIVTGSVRGRLDSPTWPGTPIPGPRRSRRNRWPPSPSAATRPA